MLQASQVIVCTLTTEVNTARDTTGKRRLQCVLHWISKNSDQRERKMTPTLVETRILM